MINDANKALSKIYAALTRAGYKATLRAADGRVDVAGRDGSNYGTIHVGTDVAPTTLCTKKIRLIAFAAATGC